MQNKKFKNLEEQIKILKAKGLSFADEDYAKSILLRENYFFINGYRHVFYQSKSNRHYVDGAMFEELYSLFKFDRKLRNILLRYLLVAENNFKSILSYLFSKKYGYRNQEYLRVDNFTDDSEKQRHVKDVVRKMRHQMIYKGKRHTATEHYLKHYGYIPLWVLVKVLSFGLVADMFTIMKDDDRQVIGEYYGISPHILDNYFSILSIYRNLCAHEDIVYDYRTQRNINDTVFHEQLEIEKVKDAYVKGKNDTMSVMIILRQILAEDDFLELIEQLDIIMEEIRLKIKSIPYERILDQMGFTENWQEIKSNNTKE